MTCPRCTDGTALLEVIKQGVTLDTCPSCGGVWLDKGELAKLLGQARNAEAELDREFEALRSKPREDHYGHKYKRPKSKLEKLFDIFD